MLTFNISNTIMQRQFFKAISQNPEYVKTHCHDSNIPFHFACRKWILKDSSLINKIFYSKVYLVPNFF